MATMRINLRKIQWLALIAALSCIGWADSWDQLKTTAGAITSVQADFVQEKHMPILTKPLVSKGVFYYQAPRAVRWEYQWPVQSIVAMYNGNVRRFVAAGGQGFTEESGGGLQAMQVVMEEITHWLAGRFDDNPMFQVRLEPGRCIVLVPKEEAFQKVIQRIVLNLGQQPGVIRSVVIYESENAFTQLTFSHTVLNARIEDDLFKKIP